MNHNGSSASPNAAVNGAVEPAPRILVVDDQPQNTRAVGGILGRLGYAVESAADGPTALKLVESHLPDLILLDVLMPGMDGLEVCRRIRAHGEWKDIPIIFLSAANDKELIVRALEAGGVDYVTKPFNHAEMVMRVRTHLALKEARDRQKELAEDRDELLGILAHDLKNHLGGMQMSANLLRERMARNGESKQLQLCENICQSTSHLLSFVKEFLANSAADHGLRLTPTRLDLKAIVQLAVEDYHEAARRKNLKIQTDFPPSAADVLADRNALVQVLDNLMSNAVKFSPPDRRISVHVRRAEQAMECLIRDEGPGFTDDDKTRMFRRYGRLSARPTAGEPSTGLGLSIVKKLVVAMNGELGCDSAPGNGTAFTVRLPQPPPD